MKSLLNRIVMIVKAILKRWSSPSVKRVIWDNEFSNGKWDYLNNTCEDVIYQYLEKYSNNGDILDLGCGSGNTGNEINIHKYTHYTGVDISEHAIQKARAKTALLERANKNRYIVADILGYIPEKKYDVMLFRESIYYIPIYRIKKMFNIYADHLKENGVCIVRMCDAGKYKSIINLIEKNYRVMEKHFINNTKGIIIIFKSPLT
jgi:SAM-dependent methyltransferase